MVKPEILEKKSLNMVELKSELNTIQSRDGELTFRGTKTIEHLNDFARLSQKEASEIFSKLEQLGVPRFKDTHMNKIIDTMPSSEAQLKVILQGYNLAITKDMHSKIINILKDYIPKKKESKKVKEPAKKGKSKK